jgi:hypothetical protein
VVVGEAVGVAADLLGEHVDVLDASVGCLAGVVVGENLVAPSIDRACLASSATSASAQCDP